MTGTLDLSAVPLLEEYESMGRELHSLDLSGLKNLKSLNCSGNLITTLDVYSNSGLVELFCSPTNDSDGNNVLETLYVSKGHNIPGVTVNRSTDHVPSGTKVLTK
ncbi:MAG: hypothetical protein IJ840_05165 [Bacteroidales bacterium]|nr:hypothetical protein [Bacteroidales bacterium]